nr:SDR family NAD(P)-dependent oxidoreductase [Actinomycetota bacterium]
MSVLAGKVALVTGASRGVGAAIANVLADEGAAVVVNYLKSEERAEAVAGGIRGRGGRAVACQADVTDEDAVKGMVEAAAGEFGPVDVLVN